MKKRGDRTNKHLPRAITLLLALTLICSFVPPALAFDYPIENLQGGWQDFTYPTLSGNSSSVAGNLTVNFGQWSNDAWQNSSGVTINWMITVNSPPYDIWQGLYGGTESFFFSFQLIGWQAGQSTSSRWVLSATDGFPLGKSSELLVGWDAVNPYPWYFGNGLASANVFRANYSMQIMKVDNTTVRMSYGYGGDIGMGLAHILKVEYFTVSQNFWDSTSLKGHFGHRGIMRGGGSFEVTFSEDFTLTNQTPLNGEEENGGGGFFGDITEFFDGLIKFLGNGYDIVKSMVTMLVSIFYMVVPVLPMIILLYALDVGVSSIRNRSFQPVGDAVLKIWAIGVTLWNSIIAFGQLVWDAITFWS